MAKLVAVLCRVPSADQGRFMKAWWSLQGKYEEISRCRRTRYLCNFWVVTVTINQQARALKRIRVVGNKSSE